MSCVQKTCYESICFNQPVRPCQYEVEPEPSPPPAPSAVSCTLPSTGAQPLGLWSSIHLCSLCSRGVMPPSLSSLLALGSERKTEFMNKMYIHPLEYKIVQPFPYKKNLKHLITTGLVYSHLNIKI